MKKKAKTAQIKVPNPCQEDWNAMHPLPGGRFCSRCEKTVVDFTQLTEREALRHFLRRPGRVCGRFREDQLEKAIPLPEPAGQWQQFRALGALLSGLLLSGAAAAQTALQQPPTVVQAGEGQELAAGQATPTSTAEGSVTDENGEPLIGASVVVKGPAAGQAFLAGTATDVDGWFSLEVPRAGHPLQLVISYMGYEARAVAWKPEDSLLHISMKRASYELEAIEVRAKSVPLVESSTTTGLMVLRRSSGGGHPPSDTAEEAGQVQITNVFPNPFTSHIHVELSLEKPARLLFHLYNASGNLVFAKTEELPPGQQVIGLELSCATSPPAPISSGFPIKRERLGQKRW